MIESENSDQDSDSSEESNPAKRQVSLTDLKKENTEIHRVLTSIHSTEIRQ